MLKFLRVLLSFLLWWMFHDNEDSPYLNVACDMYDMDMSYSIGGLILDFAVSAYDGIAVFQPVINGK